MRIGIFVRAVVVVLSFFVLAMLVLGGICLVFGRSVLPYDLYSFLPLLLVTVAAALAILIDAIRQWRRVRRRERMRRVAWFMHLGTCVAALLMLFLCAALLAHVPEPFRVAGESAMGNFIYVLVLVATGLFSTLTLGAALLIDHRRHGGS